MREPVPIIPCSSRIITTADPVSAGTEELKKRRMMDIIARMIIIRRSACERRTEENGGFIKLSEDTISRNHSYSYQPDGK